MRIRASRPLGADERRPVAAPASSPRHPPPTWLKPDQAASHLGVSITDLLPLVESGQLPLRRILGQGLLFHRDDLDAVPMLVPPDEAARLLAAETSTSPSVPMTTTDPTNPATTPSSTYLPLKDAAKQLNTPYKTMLRLVHAGEIPATNLGSPTHPRFVVDPVVIRRIWDEQAQRDMRKRSSPVTSIDYSRILRQTGHRKEVTNGT